MAETLTAVRIFAEHFAPGRFGMAEGPPGVTLSFPEVAGMALLLAHKGRAEALAARLGLPLGPKRVVAGARAYIGLAPDQWLVTGEAGLAARLQAELADEASVSDQSDARALMRIEGPKARALLAKGVPLDLYPDVFCTGNAVATIVALVSVWLWQVDDAPKFELAVPRSMAGSFADWVKASAAEFGVWVG